MFKHRKKQAKKHRNGAIPTDSFADIAFLMIIYFLVATTLVKVKTITADLPTGEKQADAQIAETPTLNLRDNEMLFNDNPVTLETLNARLAALKLPEKAPEKRIVMLEASDSTPYETYFHALAAISANGGVVALVEEEE
ncbi:MAG: ExbD/TolR family protein [Phycisphaeraceae bacterium]